MNPTDERIPDHPESDPRFGPVLDTLRAWPDAPAPALAETIAARIARERLRRRHAALALAAGAMALLGTGAWLLLRAPQEAEVASASSELEAVMPAPEPMIVPVESAAAPTPVAPDELARAREWLIRHQDDMGGWTMGRSGAAANYTVGTSALAMLALADGERSAVLQESLDRAARFLARTQQPSGVFGPDITGSLYNHALACLALLRARPGGDAECERALRRGLDLLADAQRPEGGWTYLRSRGAPNTSLTVWALLVLMRAEEAGYHDYRPALDSGLAWLQDVIDEKGRAGYRRPGDHPHGSETLTAAAALCFLDHPDALDPRLRLMIENIRTDLHAAAGPIDLYRTFFQTAALRAEPEPDEELARVATRLRAVQDQHGDDAGSWPPLDRWSSAGGRVYSTALALLALNGG